MDDSIELNNELQRTFYHGFLPHADIDPLLKEEGDFVIRKTDKDDGTNKYCILWSIRTKPATITLRPTKFLFFQFACCSWKEKTVHDLINWHKTTGTPISAGSHAKLINGIGRQPWLLEHDEIQLQRKLGEGAFGENKSVVNFRDIAARNCLLSEQLEVKISDFGMSDERRIIHDGKLEKTAPSAISKLVYRCWKTEPSERPSFAEIHNKLKVLKRKVTKTTPLQVVRCLLKAFIGNDDPIKHR
uniref:Non-specific protein-tyrosine kinase n=1 Tax=Wuchereria bancrofti TaxID=6293 RepID=A0A1I8E9D4_WUCBA